MSPKSGLRFPAFWIELNCCSPQQPKEGPSCRRRRRQRQSIWRSKRDFLQLARVAGSANTKATSVHFPKSALQKLGDQAPWIRPSPTLHLDQSHKWECHENNYHPSMKKSLMQLDQFLCAVERVHEQDPNLQRAWDWFCRPSDTEGLVPLSHKDDELQPSDQDRNGTTALLATSNNTSVQDSSQWGQYFASPENAKRLVDICCEKLGPALEEDCPTRIHFVEPSCGHGDIVVALLSALQDRSVLPSRISIHGYDIDPNAIAACQSNRTIISSTNYFSSIQWTCQDFLSARCHPDANITDSTVVVCLGGPPYTKHPGGRTDSKEDQDLPELFVRHCLEEYHAKIVCFLLPRRYQMSPMSLLLPSSSSPSSSSALHIHCTTLELPSSTFYFRGTQKVKQPSIIQCFTKV